MSQLHLSLPDDVVARVKARASAAGRSVSAYLAELVAREVGSDWPAGFFDEVVGQWQGEPLARAPDLPFEPRSVL